MADCRNDCRAPVAFPRTIGNRPGLPRIAYRIGTYSDFREALFHTLDLDAVLVPWTYRGNDDPGIALLEGTAIVGDILTFYQEVYANELYLGTATLPASINELIRLVGYRLSPGVGGRGTFAFEVTAPVTIPAAFPVTADVTGLEEPADFETTDPLEALPALSRFALHRPFATPAIAAGTASFAALTADLTAAGIVLERGDRLMLADSATSPSSHQIGVVDRVETHFEQTEITIKGAWLGPTVMSIAGFKLGRDFRHFGHNAPPKQTVITGGVATQDDVDFTRFVGEPGLLAIVLGETFPDYREYALDSQVDDIGPGTALIVVAEVEPGVFFVLPGGALQPAYHVFAARHVASARNGSQTLGSLTGATTIVTLNELIASGAGDYADVRNIQIHEVTGGPFHLTGVRSALPAAPVTQLYFFGNGKDYEALDGRLLQLVRRKPKPGQSPAFAETTASIAASAIGDPAVETLRPVTLSPALQAFTAGEFPLRFPADQPPVLIRANLAVATQGKSERPVSIGNGDARAAFLTFAIPKMPLTYLLSSSATPPQVPQLTVTVDGIEWTPVASFIGRGPADRVYVVREDTAGQSYVQFGDGETGSRTPSGLGNVVITQRTGNAAFGPLKPGASADAGARLPGLEGVALLDRITGGAPAEDPQKSRVAAPGTIQSLGRLVSIRDFETETLLIPGVSAAFASWSMLDDVPAIVVTVLMDTGRGAELGKVTALLNTYNACRGPQRHAIVLRQGLRQFVFVDVNVALAAGHTAETVFPAIRMALGGLFAMPPRTFGEPEYRSSIEGVIQNVAGVAWNEVTGFGDLGIADDPATIALPDLPRPRAARVSCAGDATLALAAPHLSLAEVAAPVKVC